MRLSSLFFSSAIVAVGFTAAVPSATDDVEPIFLQLGLVNKAIIAFDQAIVALTPSSSVEDVTSAVGLAAAIKNQVATSQSKVENMPKHVMDLMPIKMVAGVIANSAGKSVNHIIEKKDIIEKAGQGAALTAELEGMKTEVGTMQALFSKHVPEGLRKIATKDTESILASLEKGITALNS